MKGLQRYESYRYVHGFNINYVNRYCCEVRVMISHKRSRGFLVSMNVNINVRKVLKL